MGLGTLTAFLVAASHNRAKIAALPWPGVTGNWGPNPPLLSLHLLPPTWFAAKQQ